MIRKCIICGGEFSCSPSDKIVTCSKECRSKRMSKVYTGRKHSEATKLKISKAAKAQDRSAELSKGTPAAMQSPKGGRFSTNSSAKRWVLLSPDKEIFECINLRQWVRENIHRFGCELNDDNVNRIAAGFRVIKKNLKSRKSTVTYKDWTLLDWVDEKNIEIARKTQTTAEDK